MADSKHDQAATVTRRSAMQTGAGALLRRFQADFPDLVYDMDLKEVVGTIGFGATSLLVRTPDKVREPQNRRAEIIVLSAL